MARALRFAATITLPFAPARLWPYVADTDRMDHAVGLPAGLFTRVPRDEGGERVTGEYRLLGRPFARWIEHPFEWERPYRYSIQREYDVGVLRHYRGTVQLQPVADGTLIELVSELTPRQPWHQPIARFYGSQTLRRAIRQYEAIARYLDGSSGQPFPSLAPPLDKINSQRLAEGLARLRAAGVTAELVQALRRQLTEAADEAVAGMRPLELAQQWGTEPGQTLDAFLQAATLGLLELHWELLCPSCRGVKATAQHLQTLAAGGLCLACHQHLLTDRDELIEARFYPAPGVRALSSGCYCVGGPMTTPHRLAQVWLAAGERRRWCLDLPPGNYRLTSPQLRDWLQLMVSPTEPATTLAVTLTSAAIQPRGASLAAGPLALELHNTLAVDVTLALDDRRWPALGATPARLSLQPAFRTLFSDEALAPGVELAVGRVGLLFSDLAGSTALYERLGEARAFRLVNDHFQLLSRAIEDNGGVLVKTIGDAVMAAFPDGRAALGAALDLQRAVGRLARERQLDAQRLLKVGVHVGPCFLVTANGRLDYFGTAVNLAARAQHTAAGGEVVATAAAYGEGRDWLSDAGLRAASLTVSLKGLPEPVALYRIDCRELINGSL